MKKVVRASFLVGNVLARIRRASARIFFLLGMEGLYGAVEGCIELIFGKCLGHCMSSVV